MAQSLSVGWSLHVPEVCPVVDLSGRITQLSTGHRVVDWEVLLGEMTQSLEVNIHVSPVTVNTRDLDISPTNKNINIFRSFLVNILTRLKYLA